MGKMSESQRRKRMQSPYTISVPVVTEFGTTVTRLIGVYFQENLVAVQLPDGTEDYKVKVSEEQFELGVYATVMLASKEAGKFRADPTGYYMQHRLKTEEANVAT